MEKHKDIISRPLASVKHDGILGLRLGDNKVNVWSRIDSLGLQAENNASTIIIKDIELKDIIRIHLDFNTRSVLDLITVFFQPQTDITQLANLVSMSLKRSPLLSSPSMHLWKCDNGCNVNLNYGSDFNSCNVIELSFGYN